MVVFSFKLILIILVFGKYSSYIPVILVSSLAPKTSKTSDSSIIELASLEPLIPIIPNDKSSTIPLPISVCMAGKLDIVRNSLINADAFLPPPPISTAGFEAYFKVSIIFIMYDCFVSTLNCGVYIFSSDLCSICFNRTLLTTDMTTGPIGGVIAVLKAVFNIGIISCSDLIKKVFLVHDSVNDAMLDS